MEENRNQDEKNINNNDVSDKELNVSQDQNIKTENFKLDGSDCDTNENPLESSSIDELWEIDSDSSTHSISCEEVLSEKSIKDDVEEASKAGELNSTQPLQTNEVSNEKEFELELDYADPTMQEDKLWQARTGLNPDSLCGAIETIIFMSDKPVSIIKLKKLIDPDMPLRIIHEAIIRLQNEYELKHHGLRLLEVAQGYQFRTKATYSKFVKDLFKVNSLVLTPSALEVLAIIAYKQPVSKIEVEKIRGVDSSHIVRGLMDKRLVKVTGRSEEVGRPVLYGTTPEFLEVFNLSDLSQLPPEHELQEIASKNEVGSIGDIKTICEGDKEKFKFDELQELDDLTATIKQIASDTPFTKSLNIESKKRVSAEGEVVKSAFDLLEEHLIEQQIVSVNEESHQSEMLTPYNDPEIVSDLTAGPFNLPELEDDFEMIDLDTGLPVTNEEDCSLDTNDFNESEEENKILSLASETSKISEEEKLESRPCEDSLEVDDKQDLIGEDLLKDHSKEEAEALSAALDEAFEKLTGSSLEALSEEETDLALDNINSKACEIEDLTDSIVSKADELDVDLSFLKSIDEDNSFDDEKKS